MNDTTLVEVELSNNKMFRVVGFPNLFLHRCGSNNVNVFKLYPKFYGDIKQHFIQSGEESAIQLLPRNARIKTDNPVRLDKKDDKQTLLQRIVFYVEKNTYMEDVRLSQAHVMEIKRKLLSAGEEKRSLMRNLDDIRNELNHTYKDMKINRTKEAYIDLARKEIELCESEKQFSDMYKLVDKEEQFLFTEFSAAINDSYEKEKLHTNFIKIISIIGTLASSFIALVFSIFMHSYQQRTFFHQRSLDDDVIKAVEALEIRMSQLLIEMNENISQTQVVKEYNRESWGSYLHRHTRWIYSWAIKSS